MFSKSENARVYGLLELKNGLRLELDNSDREYYDKVKRVLGIKDDFISKKTLFKKLSDHVDTLMQA